jgi:protein SYS1
MAPPKPTNWDPILLISQESTYVDSERPTNEFSLLQIVSMQTLHYLTLSVLIPPLLNLFAEPNSLNYEGGAANVGMRQ